MTNVEIMRTISAWCTEHYELDAYTRLRQCAKQLALESVDAWLANYPRKDDPMTAMLLLGRTLSNAYWKPYFYEETKHADILCGIRWEAAAPQSSGVLCVQFYGEDGGQFTLEISEPIDLEFPNMICFMHPLCADYHYRFLNPSEFIGIQLKFYLVMDRFDFARRYSAHRNKWPDVMRQVVERKGHAKISSSAGS